MMISLSTAEFRKLRTCPSTETLLLYTEEDQVREGRSNVVGAHLAACDFCGAEMQLLSKCPRGGYHSAATAREMPTNLRRLAEDLLAEPATNRARFMETVYELDRLTLTPDAYESIS